MKVIYGDLEKLIYNNTQNVASYDPEMICILCCGVEEKAWRRMKTSFWVVLSLLKPRLVDLLIYITQFMLYVVKFVPNMIFK